MTINDLKPKLLWHYFDELTQIPRPSKHEELVVKYLADFAIKHNLEYQQDEAGNTVIRKGATLGLEDMETIVLQSHVDMVCEKNTDVKHDFMKDPIQTYVDGNWLRTKGTTLGADNGIGVAIELAILASNDIEHGPIECLFTTDEETGLTGASALAKNWNLIKGRTLINLDSEDEGEVYIGCAGGCGTVAFLNNETESIPEGRFLGLDISVRGLKGGHSGGDIHLGRGNAIKIAARLSKMLSDECQFRICHFSGGNIHNAIPREAHIVGFVPFEYREKCRVELNVFAAQIEEELHGVDDDLEIFMETTDLPDMVLSQDIQNKLISILIAAPHGVIRMSHDIEGLVETSSNLASVKSTDDNRIRIETSQRSSYKSQIQYTTEMINALFSLAGAEVQNRDGYPGWTPNMKSPILQKSVATYKALFGKEPLIKAIHAGLECGLFYERDNAMDMISIGPTIREVHSPDECVDIDSVGKFWTYITPLLKV